MELKNSQIHPSPKGEGLLWQEDKNYRVSLGEFDTVFDNEGSLSLVLHMTGLEAEVFKRVCAKNSGITIIEEKEKS